ncbi:transcriptional regulator [Allokutzneria sp. A3M-2-11 16]|uniref:AfsR/SARP family transcriptional regulator n=1 Tax=Allokutzneria sp. A3M-2-11 16 TaxID=2962043 RepID=UPI0020B833B1|nr:transcriptional regulator [Allokutzneria sp. A3M-2-11 16]MCP3803400.1 transcriptional regulator [Allokutzneria sp. A3M-2-11 16]
MSQLRIGLLGNFEVTTRDGAKVTPTGKQRVLLASLALRRGRTVSVEEITERLWGDGPPAASATTVRGHVKRLRQALVVDRADSVIQSIDGGYRLEVDREALDVCAFDLLVQRAAETDDPDAEAELLRTALNLWRGPALADVPCESLHREVVPALEEQRRQALHRRIELDLAAGRLAGLVAELHTVVAEDPLQERFWAQLMLALCRAGRPAEALTQYERCREVLAGQLGVDPGPRLRELHGRVLAEDPALIRARDRVEITVPRQLPSEVTPFVGRAQEIAALDGVLAERRGSGVVVVDGPAGSGKTALVTRWAHRVLGEFPDGQLYCDLGGFGPEAPTDPFTALGTLLLGMGTRDLPPCAGSRSAALRSAVAGRRVLLVLDNARDAEQVRPLLPGNGVLTVITSRNQLRALVAGGGARRITVEELAEEETAELLTALLGQDARELAAVATGLPFVVRLLAERADRLGDVPLAEFTAGMREDATRAAVVGEHQVSALLRWSCAAVPDDAVALLRLLGTRADSVGLCEAAELLGRSRAETDRMLDRLAEVHLVRVSGRGRITVPPLVRAFARTAMPPDRHSEM